MKYFSVLTLLLAIFTISVSAETLVSISGSALTGVSGIKQEEGNPFRGQFESAANLGVNLQQGEEIFIDFELAMAGLASESGFSTGLLYLTLNYKPEQYKNTEVTVGSLTQPFGQFAESQTDNSSISGPFIYNDLGYTLLKKNNPVFQLASNGVKVKQTFAHGSLEASVFNGTDGYDNNPDKGFGVAVRFLNSTLVPNTTWGASFLNSNDFGNPNGLNSNTTGAMVDFQTKLDDLTVGFYAGMIQLNDYNEATEDNIGIYMASIAKDYGSHTLAFQYSMVTPKDYDGSGSGMSAAMPILGLSNITFTDVDVQRFQLAGVLHVSDTFNLHNELVYDAYGDNNENNNYNTYGILSYASLKF
ncbi:MAG: hypothetical protein VW397_06225 [Candidatus Margulisiibacteriota bacterium]